MGSGCITKKYLIEFPDELDVGYKIGELGMTPRIGKDGIDVI